MKRIILTLFISAAAVLSLGAGEMQTVKVSSARVVNRPSVGGSLVVMLVYTDRVEVLQSSRGWVQVRTEDGKEGWLQASKLSRKEISYSSTGNVASGASSEEVALAGKGFSEDVEAEYKKDSDLDFTWVDRMETWVVPVEELLVFLVSGDLEGVSE